MRPKLKFYSVWCMTKFGTGVQTVKASSKLDARQRFKKRFPKQKVLEVENLDEPNTHQSQHFIY